MHQLLEALAWIIAPNFSLWVAVGLHVSIALVTVVWTALLTDALEADIGLTFFDDFVGCAANKNKAFSVR